jgi:hypothetical protein
MVEGVFGLPEGLSYPLPEEGITSEELVQRVEGYVLSAVLVH